MLIRLLFFWLAALNGNGAFLGQTAEGVRVGGRARKGKGREVGKGIEMGEPFLAPADGGGLRCSSAGGAVCWRGGIFHEHYLALHKHLKVQMDVACMIEKSKRIRR